MGSAGIVGLFVAFLLIAFMAQNTAHAQDVEPAATDAPGTLSLRVDTPTSGGYVTTTEVINSDIVTYEIRFVNTTGAAVNNLRFETVLPDKGLDTIVCVCQVTSITVTINNALGEPEQVVIPRELEWSIAGTVPVNGVVARTFRARVVGQAGGTNIENTALAFYSQSSVSNKVTMRIVADVPLGGVPQAQSVSSTPNWFSADQGGTLDMDWADVDGDGDLDLALASTLGTSVYRNDDGQLLSLWVDPEGRVVYGVRWLDVDGDGTPELVAIGSPRGAMAGDNYVFRYNPGTIQSPDRFQLMANGLFRTDNQLTRIDTGHFNNDTLPDLLVSVNAISADCPVFILYNLGADLFNGDPACVSSAATAAVRSADVNNDGLLDVALGIFPNQVRVILNASGVLSQTNPSNLLVDASNRFLPYDFVWGDVDGDGDLDLAAAFPLQREVKIYRNNRVGNNTNFQLIQSIATSVFQTPYAVEFGDIDRDGRLDMIVGDAQPTIYWNTGNAATPYSAGLRTVLSLSGERSEIWEIRAIDQDGNGSLEISIANRNGPSMLLANYAPALSPDFTPIAGSGAGGSAAWGDVNNDGFNDLLVGSPADRNSSRVYLNNNGAFTAPNAQVYDTDSIGMHSVALGDLNRPADGGNLDVILLTTQELLVSYNGATPQSITIPGLADSTSQAVATGDMDGDGDLDLAVVINPGAVYVVENRVGESPSTPRVFAVTGALTGVLSVAWGDINGDHYLDLALGMASGTAASPALRVLQNNSDSTFTQVAASRIIAPAGTTCLQGRINAIAWADYDGDGRIDIALGNGNGPSCLLHNSGGILTVTQESNTDQRNTTALDWGDWDNDGDLDLALGSANGPVRVYANIRGRLIWLFASSQSFNATGVRWGDRDGDGDLDLAVSRGDGDTGYYENRTVEPGHLLGAVEISLLPNPSSYAYVRRPGVTRSAYQYSTSELLAGPRVGVIPVSYRLFKPDGDNSDPAQLYNLLFDFSLDGGGSWQEATPSGSPTSISTTLTRAGQDFTFNWNVAADRAISEKALFRVSVINPSTGDTVQNAVGVGVSPPFQVRAIGCYWPADPVVLVNNLPATPNAVFLPSGGRDVRASITFGAVLGEGTGVMTYRWQLDDGSAAKLGSKVTFLLNRGTYKLTLTANGQACPVARFASRTYNFRVDIPTVYLPLTMVKSTGTPSTLDASGDTAASATDATMTDLATIPLDVLPLGDNSLLDDSAQVATAAAQIAASPVQDLQGEEAQGSVRLSWNLLNPWDVQQVRVYREPRDGTQPPILEGTVPPVQASYTTAAACDSAYTVVAVTAQGESPPLQSYLTLPCAQEVQP